MRRLEFARPPRTTTGHARNAGEAVQQLAHVARERQRLTQERQAVMRRLRKIDARLQAITGAEEKLMSMIQGTAPQTTPAAAPKRPASAASGLGEVTLHY